MPAKNPITDPRSLALRSARLARGWSQVELVAQLKTTRRRGESEIGQSKVSQHERGCPPPSYGALCRYARAFRLALIVTRNHVVFVEEAAIQLPPEGD